MREIIYAPAKKSIYDILKEKNVCVYARVSHDKDDQYGSLENQVYSYVNKIEQNPLWKIVAVFAEQCSGKTVKNRNEFKKMISKCKMGKIDIILTKSVSRFSRNTVDLVKYCRELKSLGVDVWFENENIKLQSIDSMFILETYAAIAQEENRSKSEDIKWGIKAGFMSGDIGYINFICYGYIKGENGLEIHKQKAKVVRLIFKLRLEDKSLGEISKELSKRKIPSPTGKEVWSRETINKLLKNEKVCGNVLLQKTYVKDFMDGKQVKTKGEIQQVLIRENHRAIIGIKDFYKINHLNP